MGPIHRSILALDIESSTTRTNLIKLELRHQIYKLLSEAMSAAGIEPRHYEPLADRGDGVLALIHPVDEIPRPRLLHPFIPVLADLLTKYNLGLSSGERVERELRLRTVLHAGDILRDGHGFFGAELDTAFRLLDDQAVKTRLRETAAPLVLVVSGQIYESIVFHRYEGICPESFELLVNVVVCGLHRDGWVHVPGETRSQPPCAA